MRTTIIAAAVAAISLAAAPAFAGKAPSTSPGGQAPAVTTASTIAVLVTRSSASALTVNVGGTLGVIPISALPPQARAVVQALAIGGSASVGVSPGIASLILAYF
ncbi:hypothetical protein [Sagittula salina]|uniref:Uncharacterized protein n=1 Tax=Sagittula salina TaxID=2820268 RepID=A0A940MT06_9RHOB|nr:hypothetical protein [Sagittula salina]MBP0483462.1 hypothetical protein [Sagittula salina]